MEQKIAIVFPGIGYHADKPLLYYARKIMGMHGYSVVCVRYGFTAPGNLQGDAQAMRTCVEQGAMDAEVQLAQLELQACADVVLIGKSIGTAIAAAYAERHGLNARCIWFTPISETFRYPRSAMVFHGTADPWIDTAEVVRECEKHGMELMITEGANHSLETGEAIRDVEILSQVMKSVDEGIDRR